MNTNTTTVWGVVIAAGLVGAALALNAPGGSNSIAGRSITWTMDKLFPQRVDPLAGAPPPIVAAPSSSDRRQAALAHPATPADGYTNDEGEMTAAEIARSAFRARANMLHAPAEIEFRNVQAVTVLGLFNAEVADMPFLGFCGELRTPEGSGWGRPGWKPFFISETASLPVRSQGPYLDMANPSTLAKCAYITPGKDFSAAFQSGENGFP